MCNCRHTGKCCGTLKAVGNTDHTRQTWIHMQTALSPLAGCGPVGEGTSGKVLNWTVRSLNHAYTTIIFYSTFYSLIGEIFWPYYNVKALYKIIYPLENGHLQWTRFWFDFSMFYNNNYKIKLIIPLHVAR